ncbi:MAG: hypothetical protein K2Z81_03720 [Cyanobacteria bacterium]|nr:hypothetical protein [Cyanobacteriota bacterium]
MDREYLVRTIEKIRSHRETHDSQFKDRPEHANCLPRYDETIKRLEKELEKIEQAIGSEQA